MILREQLLDKFTRNGKYHMSLSESCFMISDLHKDFIFITVRQSGKSTFLSKFVILDAINNNRSSLYLNASDDYKPYINDRIFQFLQNLNIVHDVVENRTDDQIIFKNGSSITISTDCNKPYDNIVVDNGEYCFKDNNITLMNKVINNSYLSNSNRIIISCSYNVGPVPNLNFEDGYYTRFIDFVKKTNIPIIKIEKERMEMISRMMKITKIKTKIKNH